MYQVNSKIKEVTNQKLKEDEEIVFWWEILCSTLVLILTWQKLFEFIASLFVGLRSQLDGLKIIKSIKKRTSRNQRAKEKEFNLTTVSLSERALATLHVGN